MRKRRELKAKLILQSQGKLAKNKNNPKAKLSELERREELIKSLAVSFDRIARQKTEDLAAESSDSAAKAS